jgi:hypothetical protein
MKIVNTVISYTKRSTKVFSHFHDMKKAHLTVVGFCSGSINAIFLFIKGLIIK